MARATDNLYQAREVDGTRWEPFRAANRAEAVRHVLEDLGEPYTVVAVHSTYYHDEVTADGRDFRDIPLAEKSQVSSALLDYVVVVTPCSVVLEDGTEISTDDHRALLLAKE